MDDWPVQATDDELRAADALAERLTAQGLVVITTNDLSGSGRTDAPCRYVTVAQVRTVLRDCGCRDVRYEPTGETPVADVTQVAGELWVPEHVREAVMSCPLDRLIEPGTHDAHPTTLTNAALIKLMQEHRSENARRLTAYLQPLLRLLDDMPTRRAAMAARRIGGITALYEYLAWVSRGRPAEQPVPGP